MKEGDLITSDTLAELGACIYWCKRFEADYPEGLALTLENYDRFRELDALATDFFVWSLIASEPELEQERILAAKARLDETELIDSRAALLAYLECQETPA